MTFDKLFRPEGTQPLLALARQIKKIEENNEAPGLKNIREKRIVRLLLELVLSRPPEKPLLFYEALGEIRRRECRNARDWQSKAGREIFTRAFNSAGEILSRAAGHSP